MCGISPTELIIESMSFHLVYIVNFEGISQAALTLIVVDLDNTRNFEVTINFATIILAPFQKAIIY